MDNRKQTNVLSIARVANGYVVEMPDPVDLADMAVNKMTEAMGPMLEKLHGLKDEDDPVMDRIRRQQEEAVERQLQEFAIRPEAVAVDQYTYVFADWPSVLIFLEKLDLV